MIPFKWGSSKNQYMGYENNIFDSNEVCKSCIAMILYHLVYNFVTYKDALWMPFKG